MTKPDVVVLNSEYLLLLLLLLLFVFCVYRGIPPIRNWQHEMYHLLSLKMKERVGPKSSLIS